MKKNSHDLQAFTQGLVSDLQEQIQSVVNKRLQQLCNELEQPLQVSVNLTFRYEPHVSCIVSIQACDDPDSADTAALPPDEEDSWSTTTYQLSSEEWQQIAQLADNTPEGCIIKMLCEKKNRIITRDCIASAFGRQFNTHMISKVRKKLRSAQQNFILSHIKAHSGLYAIKKHTSKP